MADVFSREKRSWVMSRIRGRDTKPERIVRSFLHKGGFRFRLHDAKLPGKPDIVLSKYKTAIFVHGCFWHRHKGCFNGGAPKTRSDFWRAKLDGNVQRDRRNVAALKRMGWSVLLLWECEIESGVKATTRFLKELKSRLDN